MNYLNRIKKVQIFLEEKDLEALIVDAPLDLFYLTGLDLSLGRLFVTVDTAALFVDGRYFEECQENAPVKTLLTQGYEKKSAFGKYLASYHKKHVGFDSDHTSYHHFDVLSSIVKEKYLVPLRAPIKQIRSIKEKEEISCLRKAALLGSLGWDKVLESLEEGISEKEVADLLGQFWKSHKASHAFAPIIAFGFHTSKPHYHPSDKCFLKRGDLVLVDMGVHLEHYHSDMTRVVSFGPPKKHVEKIYHIVYKAQEQALRLCSPGTPLKDVDAAARHYIAKKGYEKHFLHSLGHGIGLEVHEFPYIRQKSEGILKEGMVITIEPGIYLPDIGGVRLENTVLITKEGYEDLTSRPLSSVLPRVDL